jgi:hypothetical protein
VRTGCFDAPGEPLENAAEALGSFRARKTRAALTWYPHYRFLEARRVTVGDRAYDVGRLKSSLSYRRTPFITFLRMHF